MNTHEIDFGCGTSIDRAVEMLKSTYEQMKEFNPDLEYVHGDFNGRELRSTMSIDEAYMTLMGKTKAQHEADMKAAIEERRRARAAYEATIPELTKHYMELAGNDPAFKSESIKNFEEAILPGVLRSIYGNGLVDNMFEIIDILYAHKSRPKTAIKKAEEKMDEQGHSGNSAGIVSRMVLDCAAVHGEAFFDKLYPGVREEWKRREQIETVK